MKMINTEKNAERNEKKKCTEIFKDKQNRENRTKERKRKI